MSDTPAFILGCKLDPCNPSSYAGQSDLYTPQSSYHTCSQPSVHPCSYQKLLPHSATQIPAAQLFFISCAKLLRRPPQWGSRSDSLLHTSPARGQCSRVHHLMCMESEGLSRNWLQSGHRTPCGPLCPSHWTESPLPSLPPETPFVPSPGPKESWKGRARWQRGSWWPRLGEPKTESGQAQASRGLPPGLPKGLWIPRLPYCSVTARPPPPNSVKVEET